MMASSAVQEERVGLSYWMRDVLIQCEKAAQGFRSGPVHDLRTALRRCRSMADTTMIIDPDPVWRRMKKAGKQLFHSLGVLRDTHVMAEWIEKLAPEGDSAAGAFTHFLHSREEEVKVTSAIALQEFDRSQWSGWAKELPLRAARIPLNSPIFAQLALERWHQARVLHGRALRNRTQVAFHDLRIAIKRFRYTIENFLPQLNEAWGRDLKELQDSLGDVHDLDVLWRTAISLGLFPNSRIQMQWRERILELRLERLRQYREKMVGPGSLWQKWRAELPPVEDLRWIGLQRLKVWASFLDPNAPHAQHVADLALQLFDGLFTTEDQESKPESCRHILQAAALLHDVGHAKTRKGHHKESARLIRRLCPPVGWTAEELRMASLIARYHRGALPGERQKSFSALPESERRRVSFLGGILRLACACDHQHDQRIRRVQVESSQPILTVRAEGYAARTALAEHLAAARHLLELACQRPVFVLPTDGEPHAA
jgi:CHAD domain-containing protein